MRNGAYREWLSLLGAEHVITDGRRLEEAETATFATHQTIPGILRPADRHDVQECLRIANRHGISVYPVSSGKNWGYGSRVPAGDQCVLMDLGRMNRIADFSEDLAYVTVEPGVTQRHLYEFLRGQGSKLWMDATGSSPDCSLIGNTMERGFGHTPYGDHFAHVCGLEVVLPDGEVVETGYARFAGAKAGPLYRWGVGPVLDGLFSQSNLGVVTRMTLWLMPKPEYFQAFYFRCDRAEGIAGIVEALRPLRLNGTLRSAVHIANDYKVLNGMQQYPWAETEGRTPLPAAVMDRLRTSLQFGYWNGSGGLYGTRRQVAEARRLLRKALKGKVDKLQFLDDRLIRIAERFAKPYSWVTGWDIARGLELVKPVYGLMKGIPTEHPLRSSYWRKRGPVPERMDPDLDGCGLLWCAPIAPADGASVTELAQITEETLLAHGFEPMISLTLITDRAVACVVSINYDREVAGQDEQALACYGALTSKLMDRGYYSYRLGIQSMLQMNGDSGYGRLLKALKNAIDPNGVLAPGRYEAQRGQCVVDVQRSH